MFFIFSINKMQLLNSPEKVNDLYKVIEKTTLDLKLQKKFENNKYKQTQKSIKIKENVFILNKIFQMSKSKLTI